MRDSRRDAKKPVEEIQEQRARKAKLEHVSYDIAESERARLGPKDLYRAVMENTYFGLTLVDRDYRIVITNRMISRRFHKSVLELIGRECFREFEKRESICPHCPGKQAMTTGQPTEVETEGVRDDGSRISVRIQAFPTVEPDGTVTGFIEIVEDITERKKAEQKLRDDQQQLKSLASQLTLTEERERRRIATELHDRISQSLVISKIKLEGLRHSVSPEDPAKILEEVCNLLGQAIVDTRTLTFDLSSPILYELGFEAAVAGWLAEEIETKHGIAAEFEDDRQPKPLDDDVRTFLFRDVRELLINVVKHAHAHKVKVSVRKVGGQICVSVEDDGVGFDPTEIVSRAITKGEFGLFSIRERLEQLGGHLEIESEPGHGCRVTMMAPLKQPNAKNGG